MNIQREVMTCPVCDAAVVGTFSADVHLAGDATTPKTGMVNASLSLTGMRVEHNCIPQPKRTRRTTAEVGADTSSED